MSRKRLIIAPGTLGEMSNRVRGEEGGVRVGVRGRVRGIRE